MLNVICCAFLFKSTFIDCVAEPLTSKISAFHFIQYLKNMYKIKISDHFTLRKHVDKLRRKHVDKLRQVKTKNSLKVGFFKKTLDSFTLTNLFNDVYTTLKVCYFLNILSNLNITSCYAYHHAYYQSLIIYIHTSMLQPGNLHAARLSSECPSTSIVHHTW